MAATADIGFPRALWEATEADPALVRSLAGALGVPMPLARLLAGRGMASTEAADLFLNPRLSALGDPFALPNMAAAAERLWQAIDRRETVAVFGDYDVDGVCSTALLALVLRALGASVRPFLPNRLDDGYGLSVPSLKRVLTESRPELVVTVDCGTGSVEAVDVARAAGVDVIVTDHHEPDGPTAAALALVNPKLGDDAGLHTLAGVGVAFKLCHALVKSGRAGDRAVCDAVDLRDYLDIVAVATVADVVPLQGENRILVRHGLDRLNRAPRPGFAALMDVAGVKPPVNAMHIGYAIGPRLNAAGRLGSAEQALELLLTDDREAAAAYAAELDAANRERKTIEAGILSEADAEIAADFDPDNTFALVIGRQGWHVGTIGIVAARLCGKYWRPAVVISLDEAGRGRGSCRSIEGLDILDALRDCHDLLLEYGGHRMAAGLSVEAGRLGALKERLNQACRTRLAGRPLKPVQRIDAWVGLGEIDLALVEALDRAGPWGNGNPEPVWGVRNARLAAPSRRVGRDAQHLKLTVAKGASQFSAIGFNLGDREPPEGELDIAFQVKANDFRGRVTVDLHICDMRPAAELPAAKSLATMAGETL